MKLLYTVTVLLFAVTCCPSVNGKRFTLRPISAREVYRVLHEAGQADVIPEGRIVTQGIAAVSGFGAGILKGIGGAALFDTLVSNETMQMVTNFNTSALSSLFSGLGGGSSAGTEYTAQEICFSTRSAREGRQASDGEKIMQTSNSPSYSGTTGTTSTSQPTGTTSTSTMNSPTTSQTTATAPTTTQGDTGSNTGSLTQTMTQTGTGAAVNCVVIEKPKRK